MVRGGPVLQDHRTERETVMQTYTVVRRKGPFGWEGVESGFFAFGCRTFKRAFLLPKNC
jgi:hypothetical protein